MSEFQRQLVMMKRLGKRAEIEQALASIPAMIEFVSNNPFLVAALHDEMVTVLGKYDDRIILRGPRPPTKLEEFFADTEDIQKESTTETRMRAGDLRDVIRHNVAKPQPTERVRKTLVNHDKIGLINLIDQINEAGVDFTREATVEWLNEKWG